MTSDTKKDMDTARLIAEKTADAGGRAYYVGGFVRDRLRGEENKDVDIEVHGISYADLKAILEEIGGLRVTGASFGVFGLKGCNLDIAMPRSEKATGRGHRDFEIFVDPFIGPERASLRRDFTINAMMEDVLSGEILDFHGGREDLEKKILRRVSDESFAEDPLRVLRCAQFAARFDFTVEPETLRLCRDMDLSQLSKERVETELSKALLKAEKPSVFFSVLREMKQLAVWFKETEALIDVPQNPVFHPEGDVWNHTMKTLDVAAELRDEAENPRAFMYSALCHDFGKPSVTEAGDGKIHAYRHETEGLPTVKGFISRLTAETGLSRYVLNMTQLHMRPNIMVQQGSSDKAFMKLFDESVCPGDLLLLSKADYMASSGGDYSGTEEILRSKLQRFRELMLTPEVQGADLIEAGIKPGPGFRDALEYAHKLHLAGIEKSSALVQTLGYIKHRC